MVDRSKQKNHQYQSRRWLILFFILLSAVSGWQYVATITPSVDSQSVFIPDPQVRMGLASHQYSGADLLWLRWIQNLDLQSDGQVLAQLLDVITEFAPSFYRAYLDGGTFLSVFTPNTEGAEKIFLKGLRQFPNDWQLHHRAAYHELFELKNDKLAAEHLGRAAQLGAPMWTAALASDLYNRQGQLDLARQILLQALQTAPNKVGAEVVEQKLKQITAKLP